MIDTNVLISAYVFPTPNMQILIDKVAGHHHLILCSHIIDELHKVVSRKFPERLGDLEGFLTRLPYELVYTPKNIAKQIDFEIRDIADSPILISAIIADADILLTGDKDFFDVDVEKPEILTPSEFLTRY
jgi:putative PIN family toxin of toxin-antitoxin system